MAPVMRRLLDGPLPMVTAFLALLAALVLMGRATENSARFGELYSWLLLLSITALVGLLVVIGRKLTRLMRQYRRGTPGSRLTLRLVVLFVGIAIAPVGMVYSFSLQFLQRAIDSWFDVQVGDALSDALELSRAALDLRMREALRATQRVSQEMALESGTSAATRLDELRDEIEAGELTLFGRGGHIIASASADPANIIPNRPPDVALIQAQQGRDYLSLDPIQQSGFHVRVVTRVAIDPGQGEERILQALFPISDRFSTLGDSVRAAFDGYRELAFLRNPLKTSFILVLSLVLVLSTLVALWTALYAARRLVAPIRDLAEGTRAVAAGEFDTQLPLTRQDELGFLVHSFNEMTRNLSQARDSARRSQRLLEREHDYLEAVLARLSSGVLTLDRHGQLRACNRAASQILGVDLSPRLGTELTAIDGDESESLNGLIQAILPHVATPGADWREEITLFGNAGRQVLLCRGSDLPSGSGGPGGHVVVFDDITALVQAERDAAWGEVARRLAHEIKNPLTPIQLAAERIRHKYLKDMDDERGRVLERSTHTIIQQVKALKEMVDAFDGYAHTPKLHLVPTAINAFVTEVLYLYRDYPAGVEIRLSLDPENPQIDADAGRLRQVLHNLVKNALEAMSGGQGSTLQITTRQGREGGGHHVELVFQDDGPGLPDGAQGNIFEPYVTTKPKGTGLGLAIVKKIVEEHGGLIRAETPSGGGARVVIRLPARADDPTPHSPPAVAGLSRDKEPG